MVGVEPISDEVASAIERHTLVNALKHSGRAELGAVVSKVLGEFPELRARAQAVSRAVLETVKRVNALTPQEQGALLTSRYPGAGETKAREGRVGLPELPDAVRGAVVLRLPPEPSGYMHIGHAMAGTINHTYREMYAGELWLRFEDTNPRKVERRYYESFRAGYRWLGIGWDKEKNVSEDLEQIYDYGRKLLESGHAYVCGCPAERVKKLRSEGRPCEHREQDSERNLRLWEQMLARKFAEGEQVVRFKGEMASLDYSLRDPNILRIIDHDHPLTGGRYHLWPTYDFEVVIEDHICGVSHILRSSEFHHSLQDRIRQILSFKPVHTHQFSRFNFKGTPVQKRLLRPLVEKGLVSGWDDPRMPTIEGVRRRGITSDAIRQFTLQVGYTKAEHEYDWSLLFAVNRKLLDPLSKRIFYVPKQMELRISGAGRRDVTIPFHPERDLGTRTIQVADSVHVPSDEISAMQTGETFRLMELFNVRLTGKGKDVAEGEFAGEQLVRQMPKLQWVAGEGVPIEVMEPGPLYNEDGTFNAASMKISQGLAEGAFRDLRLGEVVQFPRYGFCRVDSEGRCVMAHR